MDRAIAINPNDALGLAGHGNLLMWLGQTDAAIEVLELALGIKYARAVGNEERRWRHVASANAPMIR